MYMYLIILLKIHGLNMMKFFYFVRILVLCNVNTRCPLDVGLKALR